MISPYSSPRGLLTFHPMCPSASLEKVFFHKSLWRCSIETRREDLQLHCCTKCSQGRRAGMLNHEKGNVRRNFAHRDQLHPVSEQPMDDIPQIPSKFLMRHLPETPERPTLKGDDDGAIHAFELELKHHPCWTTAYDSLGKALKARGDHMGDIHAFEKAVEDHPRWQWGYEKLEAIYRSQGEGWRIIDKYKKELSRNPKSLWGSEKLKKTRLEYGNKIPVSK